jgi:hypothetical protein
MRRFAQFIQFFSGLVIAWILASPIVAWFRLRSVLEHYGSGDALGLAYEIYLRDVIPYLGIALFVLALCVFSARLISARRKFGWTLWLSICMLNVFAFVVESLLNDASAILFLKGGIWITLLVISWVFMKAKKFESWWLLSEQNQS